MDIKMADSNPSGTSPRFLILLVDRVGFKLEKGYITNKKSPFQVLKGEIVRALPEDDQPAEKDQIGLVSLERGSVTLQCSTADVGRLTEDEAHILLAISSQGERYNTFMKRNMLDAAQKINGGEQVLVKVKNSTREKEVKGAIWYKGALDESIGYFFGVEILEKDAALFGTCDGSYKGKTYFTCTPNTGVFVSLDKIVKFLREPKQTEKKSSSTKSKLTQLAQSYKYKDAKTKTGHKLALEMRVVTFIEDKEARGTVKYIAKPTTKSDLMVGIQLDKPLGKGNGEYYGSQPFKCLKDYATFQPVGNVISEKTFDEEESKKNHSSMSSGEEADKGADSENDSHSRSSSTSSDLSELSKVMGMTKDELIKQSEKVLSEVNQERHSNSFEASEQFQKTTHADQNNAEYPSKGLQQAYIKTLLNQGRSNGLPDIPPQNHVLSRGSTPSIATSKSTNNKPYNPSSYQDLPPEYSVSQSGKQPPGYTASTSNQGAGYMDTTGNQGVGYTDTTGNQGVGYTDTIGNQGIHSTPLPSNQDVRYPPGNQGTNTTYSSGNQGLANPPGYTPNTPGKVATNSPSSLEIGCMVEILGHSGNPPRYGVIKWVGKVPNLDERLVAGLELEEELDACSDGTFSGQRYFDCPQRRGFFTLLSSLRRDSRFQDNRENKQNKKLPTGLAFGSYESPVIRGVVPPPSTITEEKYGFRRGIQGHHNSCYLDASLYSMFAFSPIFDSMLHRPPCENDLAEYSEVQTVLRDSIINPLRSHGFVRADKVLHLRKLLDRLGSTSGLVSEEKDPEEFLNTLFHQVFKMEPLLHLKSADRQEGAFFYQMFTEKDNTAVLPTVQQLLEQSFISSDIKLGEIPSCLILQMPRYGSKYKMYNRIQPSLTLDITKIVENVPHECHLCGKLARNECKDCFVEKSFGEHAVIAHFCDSCFTQFHGHRNRTKHQRKPIPVPREYPVLSDGDDGSACINYFMELFAVVCIETSHYVAFVKSGLGTDAPWVFFDSMADRKGEKDGYNIPCVSPCPEFLEWINDRNRILQTNDKEMPERVRRLLGDAYLCLYQNVEVGMYH